MPPPPPAPPAWMLLNEPLNPAEEVSEAGCLADTTPAATEKRFPEADLPVGKPEEAVAAAAAATADPPLTESLELSLTGICWRMISECLPGADPPSIN